MLRKTLYLITFIFSVQSHAGLGGLYCNRILDQLVREQAQTNYLETTKYTYLDYGSPLPQQLARRLSQKDSHPHYLIRLGYRLITEDGVEKLVPPENFETIFMNYEVFMRSKINSTRTWHEINKQYNELKEEDVIWASLVFIRKGIPVQKAKLTDFYLMRYGKDLQPDLKEFTLLTPHNVKGLNFSPEIFLAFLAQGKIPVGLDGFFDHELGHLTEFMERPFLMKRIKDAAWAIITLEGKASLTPEEKQHLKNMKERFFYLMEFMAVPHIKNEELIKKHIQFILDDPTRGNLVELRKYLKQLPISEVVEMAKNLIKDQNLLFYKMGGGHRDAYNSNHEPSSNNFREESPLVLLWNIESEMKDGYHGKLISKLSRVQLALYAGVKYQVTPEKLYEETMVLHPPPKLDSVKFFSTFSPPIGDLWRFFVADN